MAERPSLLFYCQHALGLGHLVRSLTLAESLAEQFDVLLLNGGRFPDGTRVPAGVRVVNLPPLGHDAEFQLISHDPAWSLEEAMRERPRIILDTLATTEPAVVLVELYPFGRKKFEFELLPLLDAVHSIDPYRPRVVCSVRDILVGRRDHQSRHDERACLITNKYFDMILVHSDPHFARLEDSFRPVTPLKVPVQYTGFVTGDSSPIVVSPQDRLQRVLVSAGGGMVGEPLLRAAVDAHRTWRSQLGLATTILAGPFAPEPVWTWLQQQAAAADGLDVARYLPDLRTEMARSAVSVSQGGYNTTMDILRAGVPAVVVPYSEAGEDEQQRRAMRLEDLGVLRCLRADELNASTLADAVIAAAASTPAHAGLDLDGRVASVRAIAELCAADRQVLA